MGEFIYSAETGSVISEEALGNPYHRFVTLTGPLFDVPFMETIITDSHFFQVCACARTHTVCAHTLTTNEGACVGGFFLEPRLPARPHGPVRSAETGRGNVKGKREGEKRRGQEEGRGWGWR